jgi:hypothetical protein
MKYRFELDRWECPGYDGEGCMVITSEDLDREGLL